MLRSFLSICAVTAAMLVVTSAQAGVIPNGITKFEDNDFEIAGHWPCGFEP